MSENDDERPPMMRLAFKNGMVIYPKMQKNAEGNWEIVDKSLLEKWKRDNAHLIIRKDSKTTESKE